MANYNPVNWFEIYVDDIDRARKFYETVLNKPMVELARPEGMDSRMISFPSVEEGRNTTGAIVQMAGMKPGGNSTIVYFYCDNCATEEKRVEGAGGKVFQAKFAIGEYGFCTLCLDTEGNMFGLHSMK